MSAQSQPLAPSSRPGGVLAEAKPSLTLRRWLNAPPARVYAAWTDPQKLAKWWGPGTPDDMLVADLDVRVGGDFHIGFSYAGERHDVHGTYQEVVPGEKLVFSWFWKSTPDRVSLVTVRCRPDGEGCMLTLIHEQFFDEAARLGHTRGWTASLNKLEAYMAREA